MNLFSSILRLFGIGGLSNSDRGAQVGSVASQSTDAGITVTDERAMQVSAVWACVQYITNSVCSLPINFYRKAATGREEIGRHYLTDLFHNSPNQLMKPRDFRKAMTMQLCLWSNAYAEIFFSGDRPVALVPLRPGRMTPFLTDSGELTYHYQMEQGVRIYSKRSIFHMKGFGPDGIVGLERNNYARKSLGLSVSADTYASKQFAHGGRSGGGYLMFDTFLTPEQREQARALYSGMSETAYNAGKLWILEGGVKYETDTLNPDTMQMIETRRMQLSEIARFFGVPEVMIGAGSNGASAWPASFEQQLLSFLTFTLQDYLDEWELAIKDSLIMPRDRGNVFADHDVTGFIKMDSQAKANIQSTWVQNGLKTRNEIRRMNNDPAIDGGDDLTVQVNLTPVDKLASVGSVNTVKQDEESLEIKNRLAFLESEGRISRMMPEPKQVPSVFNIGFPKQDAPIVNIDSKNIIPKQSYVAPVVNVQNDVHVPAQETPIVNVSAPDVTVNNDVKTPEVNVENNIEMPDGERKVTFNRDSRGDIVSAKIDD